MEDFPEFATARAVDRRETDAYTEGRADQRADDLIVINELLQALMIARTALGEMKHAHFNPGWFTHGKDGATQQFLLWQRKGSNAVNEALLKAEGLNEPKD